MKTKEFVRRLIDLGFITGKVFGNISVYKDGCEIALVEPDKMYGIVSGINDYHELLPETQHKLFNLLVEYASTPLEEREEEVKYYIRMKNLDNICNYLNYNTHDEDWCIDTNWNMVNYKTRFTLSELPDWVREMLGQGHLVKEEVE